VASFAWAIYILILKIRGKSGSCSNNISHQLVFVCYGWAKQTAVPQAKNDHLSKATDWPTVASCNWIIISTWSLSVQQALAQAKLTIEQLSSITIERSQTWASIVKYLLKQIEPSTYNHSLLLSDPVLSKNSRSLRLSIEFKANKYSLRPTIALAISLTMTEPWVKCWLVFSQLKPAIR
jgi:hypothetical protein